MWQLSVQHPPLPGETVPSQQDELAGSGQLGDIVVKERLWWGFTGEMTGPAGEEWDLDSGAETPCFAGKATFCQGTERGQLVPNIREIARLAG